MIVIDDVGGKLHVASRWVPLVPSGRPIKPNGEALSGTSQTPAATLHTVLDTYLHFENVFNLDIH